MSKIKENNKPLKYLEVYQLRKQTKLIKENKKMHILMNKTTIEK